MGPLSRSLKREVCWHSIYKTWRQERVTPWEPSVSYVGQKMRVGKTSDFWPHEGRPCPVCGTV